MKPVKSIATAGILAALHVGAMFLAKFVPGLQFILIFLLPFASAVYSRIADAKYCLVYFLATALLSIVLDFVIPAGDVGVSLFFIIPTLVAGTLYGVLVRLKQGGTAIVYGLTIAEFGLILIGAAIAKGAMGNEFVEQIELFFESVQSKQLMLGLIIAYCFAQSFLVHICTKNILKRFKIEVKPSKYPPLWIFLLFIASLICCFVPFKENTELWAFLAAVSAIVFGLPIALHGYQVTEKVWILIAVQAVVFLGGTVPLMVLKYNGESSYKQIAAFILVFLPPLVASIISVFKQDYKKPENQ